MPRKVYLKAEIHNSNNASSNAKKINANSTRRTRTQIVLLSGLVFLFGVSILSSFNGVAIYKQRYHALFQDLNEGVEQVQWEGNMNSTTNSSGSSHDDGERRTGPFSTTTTSTSSTSQSQSQSQSQSLAIFFNIYIPDEATVNHAKHIVEEQLHQIRDSFVGSRPNTAIYITTVGYPAWNRTTLHPFCNRHAGPRLSCIHQRHLEEGWELDGALQSLHDYCLQKEAQPKTTNDTHTSKHHRVIYIHNKGSFHAHQQQTNWRRALMKAVTSKECVQPPHDVNNGTRCNMCGLGFHAPPIQFANVYTGNFFTADCDYVAKLHTPTDFAMKMQWVRWRADDLAIKGRFVYQAANVGHFSFGIGRYAGEHWIASHPDLSPCDMSQSSDWWHWHTERPHERLEWSMAPRYHVNISQLNANRDERLRDYFLLAGIMYRYLLIYDALPPMDSWVWKYFPDGAQWKNYVQLYGKKVVEVVTGPTFPRNNTNVSTATTVQLRAS